MNIILRGKDGSCRDIAARPGLTLMEALRDAGLIEGECNGSLACATCHVWIDPAWAGRLPAPTAGEEDMLDVAFHLAPTSRLSCQVKLVPELDGITVSLPAAG